MTARDLSIYVAISLIVVGLAAGYGIWSARHNLSDSQMDVDFKWFAFVVFSCFIFGSIIHAVKGDRRHAWFWALIGSSLAVHFAIGVSLLKTVERFPLLYYVPIAMAEFAVLFVISGLLKLWLQRRT